MPPGHYRPWLEAEQGTYAILHVHQGQWGARGVSSAPLACGRALLPSERRGHKGRLSALVRATSAFLATNSF